MPRLHAGLMLCSLLLASALARPAAAGTVSYWQLDDASGALVDVVGGFDLSPCTGAAYGQAALVSPVPSPEAGPFSDLTDPADNAGGVDFTNAEDDCSNPSSGTTFHLLPTSSFTFEGFLRVEPSATPVNGIIGGTRTHGGVGGSLDGWMLLMRPNGTLAYVIESHGSIAAELVAGAGLPGVVDGQVHHFALVWDHDGGTTAGGRVSLYLDGALYGSADDVTDPGADNHFNVGWRRFLPGGFPGTLDEIRFSDEALEPEAFLRPPLLVAVSRDVTFDHAGSAVPDERVVDARGAVVPVAALPHGAEVDGYDVLANGDVLFTLETTLDLGGGLVPGPADVVRFDGGAYTLAFGGRAEGVPFGISVDAVTADGSDLLLSFDGALRLSGHDVADEDLVRWDGAVFTPFFQGAAELVPRALDLDAAHYDASGRLLLSFDGAGRISSGGLDVDFHDEDVLVFDTTTRSFGHALPPVVKTAAEVAADVDAVALPEPSGWLAMGAGAGLLAVLSASRRPRRQEVSR